MERDRIKKSDRRPLHSRKAVRIAVIFFIAVAVAVLAIAFLK